MTRCIECNESDGAHLGTCSNYQAGIVATGQWKVCGACGSVEGNAHASRCHLAGEWMGMPTVVE